MLAKMKYVYSYKAHTVYLDSSICLSFIPDI